MQFDEELARVLPGTLPHRSLLIGKAARHLGMIAAANEYMNLTRITSPPEAVIKHVYDCVAPWEHFQSFQRVLDAGTGAGFPGVPLALVLPHVQFTLAESTQKKARFVESVVSALELTNVKVMSRRAEEVAIEDELDAITARAVAPISRVLDLFDNPMRRGVRLLLYKGPDVASELSQLKDRHVTAAVIARYELPQEMGTRTMVEVRASSTGPATPRTPVKPTQR